MQKKYKDTRQFAGVSYKTLPATPDEDAEEATFEEDSPSNPGKPQNIPYYTLKKQSLDVAIEFARLTDGPSITDVMKIAAMVARFIANKN